MFLTAGVCLVTGDLWAKDYALLVNGGSSPGSNSGSFVVDLLVMQSRLAQKGWNTTLLSADGSGETAESRAPDAPDYHLTALGSHDWELERTSKRNPDGSLVLKNSIVPGAQPATREELTLWFQQMVKQTQPGDRLLVYFTDHGSGGVGSNDSKVSLWGVSLSVSQLRELIQTIPEDRTVVTVHDHCHSGPLLDALSDENGKPLKNRCGFAASGGGEYAYGGKQGYTHFLFGDPAQADSSSIADRHLSVVRGQKMQHLAESSSDRYMDSLFQKKIGTDCADCFKNTGPNQTERLAIQFKMLEVDQERNRLARQLKRVPGWSPTPEEVEKLNQTLEEKFNRYQDRRREVNRLIAQYVREKKPQEYQKKLELNKKIETLSKEVMTQEQEALLKSAHQEYLANQALLAPYSTQTRSNPDFKKWLAAQDPPQQDLIQTESQLEDEFDETLMGSVSLRRLARLTRQKSVLNQLLKNQRDPAEVEHLIGLWKCEGLKL